jgi:hypothetical protein
MLLTHGARSVLRAATVAQRTGRSLDGLRRWALAVQARSNHNKATGALANRLARICFAALRDQESFASERVMPDIRLQASPPQPSRPITSPTCGRSPYTRGYAAMDAARCIARVLQIEWRE